MSKYYFIISMIVGSIIQYILAIGFDVHVVIVPIVALFFILADMSESRVLFALFSIAIYDGFTSEVIGSIVLAFVIILLILLVLRRFIGVNMGGYWGLFAGVVLSYLAYELIHYVIGYIFLITRHADTIALSFQLSPGAFLWYLMYAGTIAIALIYLSYCRHITKIHAHFRR